MRALNWPRVIAALLVLASVIGAAFLFGCALASVFLPTSGV